MAASTAVVILLSACLVKFIETEITGFIVGGSLSDIKDFPHAAFVSILCAEKPTSCGASILNQEILLTAAHCVTKCIADFNITAFTGSELKYEGYPTKVSSVKVHERYNLTSKENDIALLKLENSLTFTNNVRRVALGKGPFKYETGVVAGWGWIDGVGTRGNKLKHVEQALIDYETCYKMLNFIPKGTFCGKELTGVSYPEKGDSGSALVVSNFIQIGIVSFKKRKYANDTIVYTDVSYFHNWIKENAVTMNCGSKEDLTLM